MSDLSHAQYFNAMKTYRIELDGDGICGFNTEITAESFEQAREIAKKQVACIENWEVLSLHNPPLERDMAITIIDDDET